MAAFRANGVAHKAKNNDTTNVRIHFTTREDVDGIAVASGNIVAEIRAIYTME
jgi:hypothetical protein